NRSGKKTSVDQVQGGDVELLERMLDGDEEAFACLYKRHQGSIYRFTLHMVGSPAAAEDVTQEVFIALMEGGRRFDPAKGLLLPFLYGIARNRVLRRIDKDYDASSAEEEIACDEDLLDDLTRREAIEYVRRAVVTLPTIYREVVVLCDLEDASYEEAAAALD